jgi:hypothetical protein
MPVAHTCNHSYLGARGREDHGLKPARANSCAKPCLEKNPSQKRAGRVAQGVGPEFKPQYHTHTKRTVHDPYGSVSICLLYLCCIPDIELYAEDMTVSIAE